MAKKTKVLKADTRALARAFAEQYAGARGWDLGAVEVGIIDIYDSALGLYGEVLPRIAKLDAPSADDLLEEMVDVRMELEHIDYHARLALRGLRRIEADLRKAAEQADAREDRNHRGQAADRTESKPIEHPRDGAS